MSELFQLELQVAGLTLEITCTQTRQVHEPSDDETDSNEARGETWVSLVGERHPPSPTQRTYVLAARLIPARRAAVSSRSLRLSFAVRRAARSPQISGTKFVETSAPQRGLSSHHDVSWTCLARAVRGTGRRMWQRAARSGSVAAD